MMKFFLVSLIVLSSVASWGAVSNCSDKEKILFSCTYKTKLISLCGSQDLPASAGYLYYRVTKSGKTELEFPKVKKGSTKFFRFNLLPRGGSLEFTNEGYKYTLSSDLNGGSFVSVEKGSSVIAEFPCKDTDVDVNLTMTSIQKILSKL